MTVAPEKELKLLFTVYDSGNKGYLDRLDFRQVVDRCRKRDRIRDPVDDSVVDAIFTLLDPTRSGQITFDTFKDKFNAFFYQTRHSFYSKAKAGAAATDFSMSPRKYKQLAEKLPETPAPPELPEVPELPPAETSKEGEEGEEKEEKANPPRPTIIGGVATRDQLQIHMKQQAPLPPGTKVPESVQSSPENEVATPAKVRVPKDVIFDIPRPALHPKELLEQLEKVPGLAGWSKQTNWVGRSPKDAEFVAGFQCPHCGRSIDEAVIEHQRQLSLSAYGGESLRPRGQTITPLYGPYIYSGMWQEGRSAGQIPPSFFSSPHNIHTWKFA